MIDAMLSFVCPFVLTPDWGAMKSPSQWDRKFSEYKTEELVPVPKYDLRVLTMPMQQLLEDRDKNVPAITAKLYYSTRFMGTYDLDAAPGSGSHKGVDFKEPLGTPVRSLYGGLVVWIRDLPNSTGKTIFVRHGEGFSTLYGHLGSVDVKPGQRIRRGMKIGEIGMTGKTLNPHLHLEMRLQGELVDPMDYIPTVCK